MFRRIVAFAVFLLLFLSFLAHNFLPLLLSVPLLLFAIFSVVYIPQDRWSILRRSRYSAVRYIYQSVFIYHFAYKLDTVTSSLPPLIQSYSTQPNDRRTINTIVASGPNTYQKKPSNTKQIESLMENICSLIPFVSGKGATPFIIDIGAGKALLTRSLYEALERTIPVYALDTRAGSDRDEFYDPDLSDLQDGEQPYTRIVADVKDLAEVTRHLSGHDRSGILITKHLCGAATDSSIKSLCSKPFNRKIAAACLAPCCHQKIQAAREYCNIAYLHELGFCSQHVGLRGGQQDNDFRTFKMLLSISKTSATALLSFEYKKSPMLNLLGFKRCCELGRSVRRILEEGRIRFLNERGFTCELMVYCEEDVTNDNLIIVAKREDMKPEKDGEEEEKELGSVDRKKLV